MTGVSDVPIPVILHCCCETHGLDWIDWLGGQIIFVDDQNCCIGNASCYTNALQKVSRAKGMPIKRMVIEPMPGYNFVQNRRLKLSCRPSNYQALKEAQRQVAFWFNGEPTDIRKIRVISGIAAEEVASFLASMVQPRLGVQFTVRYG